MPPKKKIKIALLTLFAIAIAVFSCVEFEEVSPIPEINYLSFDVVDGYDTLLDQPTKIAQLEFDFIDGDADIGVERYIADDESLPDSVRYTVFIDLYDKVDGEYNKRILLNSTLDTATLHVIVYRDQKLERVGQNKTVKGKMTINTQLTAASFLRDTFRLEFFIRDRALNKSNIETTDDYLITD
jgi:hypothetical protein